MDEINSHCSYCGTQFPESAAWPRTCANCGKTSFRNPLPVCVVLIPIKIGAQTGALAIRRAILPRIGDLALPGGYINFGETWQEAGAREVFEETGLEIDPTELREFRVRSAPDGTLIIFALANPHELNELPPFSPNDETSERVVLVEETAMAFGLHTDILKLFLRNGLGK